MLTAKQKKSIHSLWKESNNFLRLYGIQGNILVGNKSPNVKTVSWFYQKFSTQITQDEYIYAARHSLSKMVEDLTLNMDISNGVEEIIVVENHEKLGFSITLKNSLGQGEIYTRINNSHDLIDLINTRRRVYTEDTEWDRACQRRIIRLEPEIWNDKPYVIEPGVVWFVEWIENLGGQTLFSCEGHPNNFYIAFTGPSKIADVIVNTCNFGVEKIEGSKNTYRIYIPDTDNSYMINITFAKKENFLRECVKQLSSTTTLDVGKNDV